MGRHHPEKHDPHQENKKQTNQKPNQMCEASWIVFISVGHKFPRRAWIRNIFGILTELNFYYSFLKKILWIPEQATSCFQRKDYIWMLLSRRRKYTIHSLSVFYKPLQQMLQKMLTAWS